MARRVFSRRPGLRRHRQRRRPGRRRGRGRPHRRRRPRSRRRRGGRLLRRDPAARALRLPRARGDRASTPLRQLRRRSRYQFYEAARTCGPRWAGITTRARRRRRGPGHQRGRRRGLIAGPRMQISISMSARPAATATAGRLRRRVPAVRALTRVAPRPRRRPRRGAQTVRELIRAGADVIKVSTTGGVLSPRDDPRHAALPRRRARRPGGGGAAAGLDVMAHAQGAAGIKAALRAGSARSSTASSSTTRPSS